MIYVFGQNIKLTYLTTIKIEVNTDLYICVHPFHLWLNYVYLCLGPNSKTLVHASCCGADDLRIIFLVEVLLRPNAGIQ
jgi:hypothetical protein